MKGKAEIFMKEIKMFMQANCPHCKRCFAMIDEIFKAHPEYKEVPLTVIDERVDPATADKYDYYYVPTFFVDEIKEHEGVPSQESVENVFRKACESKA